MTGSATTTRVACSPTPVAVGATTTCTATVTGAAGATPTGTVTFSRNSSGSFAPSASCTLVAGGAGTATCSVGYRPTAFDSGTHRVYGKYAGNLAPSMGFADGPVTGGPPRPSVTTVTCAPGAVAVHTATTCTATVTDAGAYTKTTPVGTVSFGRNSSGSFSASTCMLVAGTLGQSSCSVTYTPGAVDSGTHKIYAVSATDHARGEGTTMITVS